MWLRTLDLFHRLPHAHSPYKLLRFLINENQNGINLICILKGENTMACIRYIKAVALFVAMDVLLRQLLKPSSCIRTNMAHRVAQFEGSRIWYYRAPYVERYTRTFIYLPIIYSTPFINPTNFTKKAKILSILSQLTEKSSHFTHERT